MGFFFFSCPFPCYSRQAELGPADTGLAAHPRGFCPCRVSVSECACRGRPARSDRRSTAPGKLCCNTASLVMVMPPIQGFRLKGSWTVPACFVTLLALVPGQLCRGEMEHPCFILPRMNSSQIRTLSFFLGGFPAWETTQTWSAAPHCSTYLLALRGHLTALATTRVERSLHGPMYLLLAMLPVAGPGLSMSTFPTMLRMLWLEAREIGFSTHLAQMFFIHSFTDVDSDGVRWLGGHLPSPTTFLHPHQLSDHQDTCGNRHEDHPCPVPTPNPADLAVFHQGHQALPSLLFASRHHQTCRLRYEH